MNQQEIIQEFARRYQDSYIWVCMPDGQEESLFFVERVTYDEEKLAQLALISPEYGRIVINMATTHKLKFKYPPVGVFQSGKDAYIFRRIPAKQYKHGIYRGNSSIQPVWGQATMNPNNTRAELAFDDVAAAYAAKTYSFNSAIALLERGKHRSVALSNNFSLCLNFTTTKGYILFYWETPIALLGMDGAVITQYEGAFSNILEDVKGR